MEAFAIDAYKGELWRRNVPDPVARPGQVVISIADTSPQSQEAAPA